jgi:hypothetical protein
MVDELASCLAQSARRSKSFAGAANGRSTLPQAKQKETRSPRWLVTCSCGWGRECVSEWAAESVSKLHPQLATMNVPHVTRVEPTDDSGSDRQLSLT